MSTHAGTFHYTGMNDEDNSLIDLPLVPSLLFLIQALKKSIITLRYFLLNKNQHQKGKEMIIKNNMYKPNNVSIQ